MPVRALREYLDGMKGFRRYNQLFVRYGAATKGKGLSKDRLAHWIVEAIEITYKSRRLGYMHTQQGMCHRRGLFIGLSVSDICKAAGWSSVHTFVRFYMLDVSGPSVSLFWELVALTPKL